MTSVPAHMCPLELAIYKLSCYLVDLKKPEASLLAHNAHCLHEIWCVKLLLLPLGKSGHAIGYGVYYYIIKQHFDFFDFLTKIFASSEMSSEVVISWSRVSPRRKTVWNDLCSTDLTSSIFLRALQSLSQSAGSWALSGESEWNSTSINANQKVTWHAAILDLITISCRNLKLLYLSSWTTNGHWPGALISCNQSSNRDIISFIRLNATRRG